MNDTHHRGRPPVDYHVAEAVLRLSRILESQGATGMLILIFYPKHTLGLHNGHRAGTSDPRVHEMVNDALVTFPKDDPDASI